MIDRYSRKVMTDIWSDQKKYEMNLTTGNRNFLKVLSISVIAFFIIYLIIKY